MFLWDRDQTDRNKFSIESNDRDGGIVVHFKPENHISVTAWKGKFRKHEEFRFKYGEVPHVGFLQKGVEFYVEVFEQFEKGKKE